MARVPNAIKIQIWGDSYRKPAADGYAERSENANGLLRPWQHGYSTKIVYYVDIPTACFNNPEKEFVEIIPF